MILNLIFAVFNIFLFLYCWSAWREVWGLNGGYGRGVWAECSTYMMDARSNRRTSTVSLTLFTTIHFLAYFYGELSWY